MSKPISAFMALISQPIYLLMTQLQHKPRKAAVCPSRRAQPARPRTRQEPHPIVTDSTQKTASLPVLLASGSPYRRELLGRLAIRFESMPADADESRLPGEQPEAMVQRLADLKAESLPAQQPAALIIGSDQIAVVDGQVVGKPGNHQRACAQLAQASGKTVRFLTAVCVLDQRSGNRQRWLDETRVVFRPLSQGQIERYLRHETPYDCAGSFKCEGLGISLFRRIENEDPTALMGLPLIWLSHALRNAGLHIP